MKIYVNGEECLAVGQAMSYEEVVVLAGHDPERVLTVVYHWQGGGDSERNGSLSRGRTVAPAEGMRFTVADTSNA